MVKHYFGKVKFNVLKLNAHYGHVVNLFKMMACGRVGIRKPFVELPDDDLVLFAEGQGSGAEQCLFKLFVHEFTP